MNQKQMVGRQLTPGPVGSPVSAPRVSAPRVSSPRVSSPFSPPRSHSPVLGDLPPAAQTALAVDEGVLAARLRASLRAGVRRRRATAALVLASVAGAGWLAVTAVAGGEPAVAAALAGAGLPVAVVWGVIFVLRAWAADLHDARLRETAQSWVRVARATGGAQAFPEAFRDAFARPDRLLGITTAGLVLSGVALAIPETLGLVTSWLNKAPGAVSPLGVLSAALVLGGVCLLPVTGRQGRRRALLLLDLRRWWM